MKEDEFYNWFLERVDIFSEMGIMHPRSEWGKIVKISLITINERFSELEDKIKKLESELEESKAKAPVKPKKKATPKPKKSGWSV